jgi:predicted house-cleaning noncanonical NTP pyrophosphatase (MazG superfamily)
MIYNKLVRDKIPEILDKMGKKHKCHTASPDEYEEMLWEKLDEEIKEFKEVPCDEEMADILEVVDAILIHCGLDPYEVETARQAKASTRGSFKQRTILEEVIEK